MLHYHAELRRQARVKAHMIEAVAAGYGGVRGKDGPRAMQRFINWLRK